MTLKDVRYEVEQYVQDSIPNKQIILWANDLHSDIGVEINIHDTAQISVDTTTISYAEPAGLKQIVRMYLQSDFDNDVDREINRKYRRFNGKIIFHTPFHEAETLNVDFFRQLTQFTSINDILDLDGRNASIYRAYMLMHYYDLPRVRKNVDDANREYEKHLGRYMAMKDQVLSLHDMPNQYVVEERW